MSINQLDSDHTLPLSPASSSGAPDTVAIDITVSTGQPVVTSQVPTQVMTNPSISATNPFVTNANTNHGTSGHPTHHEWV